MVGEGETSYVHVACMQPSQLPCVKSRKLDAHDTHRCPGTIMQPGPSVHGRRLGLVEPAQEACACPEQVLQ